MTKRGESMPHKYPGELKKKIVRLHLEEGRTINSLAFTPAEYLSKSLLQLPKASESGLLCTKNQSAKSNSGNLS